MKADFEWKIKENETFLTIGSDYEIERVIVWVLQEINTHQGTV